MEPISGIDITNAVQGQVVSGNASLQINQITTDSRKAGPGSLFIPLAGERFDGHDFLGQAIEAGASAVLTARDDVPAGENALMIRVADTRKALLDLARAYRKQFSIPVVGVTGSVGKTTTKDMVASVLGQSMRCLKTEGNFNNEIGLPLTMFRLDRTCDIAVVEMGMSAFGEIDRLASAALPNAAVITNIGMSHIESLGSQENIRKAKLEILNHLQPGGLVVLNGDDPLLWEVRGSIPNAVYVGIENRACGFLADDVQTRAESVSFRLTAQGKSVPVSLQVPGIHNVYNAMAAAAVGIHFGIPLNRIIAGLEEFTPSGMRMDIIKLEHRTIINDCYNASPASMKAALDVLAGMEAPRKIAVLGDMLEMGGFAYQAHRNVGAAAARCRVDRLVTVGEHGKLIGEGAFECGMDSGYIRSFDTNEQALKYLTERLKPGDAVLVKASRGMHFEQIVEGLRAQ